MELNAARLESCIDKKEWDTLSTILKPKFFPRDETGKLASPIVLAKLAETLTNSSSIVPNKVRIILIKCLMNSCVNGYDNKTYTELESMTTTNTSFYTLLCESYQKFLNGSPLEKFHYPISTHFPYNGVVKWAADYVSGFRIADDNSLDEELELLRLNIQFLCNLCQSSFPCVEDERFKRIMIKLIQHEHLPIMRAACAFIHNTLTLFKKDYYTDAEKDEITVSLIKAVKLGIPSAIDALKCLLKDPERLQNIYEGLAIENRLYLLEVFHQDLRESDTESNPTNFPCEVVSFLSKCFKRKSDLVLKTVNSYLNGTEPMEIMILLDILGVLTSRTLNDKDSVNNLQGDKSLLINCIYLLKSLHMVGKESENFFTPVQKLSELAPSGQPNSENIQNNDDVQSHPAFGFKAGLIRVIGNMVHKHKENQDLLRETDGIPLLLDCCNMDARNPLIMQWTILAMRNVCENNKANQDVVQSLNKVGVANNSVLREMGITLHDDGVGKAVGIIPLTKNQ